MNLPVKRLSKSKRARDQKTQRVARRLKKEAIFANLPHHIVRGYAALYVLSTEVKSKLDERGLVDDEGNWSGGIDSFRRLMDSQGRYLSLMIELNGKDQRTPKPVLDLDDFRDDEKASN